MALDRHPAVLDRIRRSDTDLAIWSRPDTPPWQAWLDALPATALPAGRIAASPRDVDARLHALCDARGTAPCGERDAWIADVVALSARFVAQAGCDAVALRLEVVTGDACRRWHRDCVPLRLLCTYRGPATEWVLPSDGDAVLAHADDDAPGAHALGMADVALFKGCGWPGRGHEGGVVHRSPRVAGRGLTRLMLALDPAPPTASFVPA